MKLSFDFLSDSDVSRLSSFLLNETWDLYDPRFGTFGKRCPKCVERCTGHFARLELGDSIFHPYFVQEIREALTSICEHCGGEVTRSGKRPKCIRCLRIVKAEYVLNHRQLYLAKGPQNRIITPKHVKQMLHEKEERKYVISSVLVPPIGIRPPEDAEWPSDLAKAYSSLVESVRKRQGTQAIANSFNRIAGIGRPEAVMKLLSGKEGIFRSIMLGKRLDRCARSVIAGDPNIDIDKISIPKIISEKVKIPERVHDHNVKAMMTRASIGKVWCPKRQILIGPEDILCGMIFDRCLEDGDRILFNRQPSLSRSSLLSFRVVISKQPDVLSIRFNPLVTSSFNADFDGDEMNIFAGYGIESKAEMDILCDVKENIYCDNLLMVKAIQDTTTAIYLLTSERYEVSNETFFDCMCICERYLFGPRTGRTLFSLNLPEEMKYEDDKITIRNGILEKGIIDAQILNEKIVKTISRTYGSQRVTKFLQDIQKTSIRWMLDIGFNVASRDIMWSKEDLDKVKILNQDSVMNKAYEICEEHYSQTSIMSMIQSGAKGSIVNAAQMSVSLGQQYIDGKKKGFIDSSYLKGLTSEQFVLHAMAAREGVIHTGLGTSVTGYLNRRACKVVSGIRERYNGTIGTEEKTIQF
jgi:DNA-directed RNA polymerase beta' subunit